MTPKRHQSTRSLEIIKENIIKLNKQKRVLQVLKRSCLVSLVMMFACEDPDFSTYGIIRAENRKGMQQALSGLVFQPGRTYTFGSSANSNGIRLATWFHQISPFCGFLGSGRFFCKQIVWCGLRFLVHCPICGCYWLEGVAISVSFNDSAGRSEWPSDVWNEACQGSNSGGEAQWNWNSSVTALGGISDG